MWWWVVVREKEERGDCPQIVGSVWFQSMLLTPFSFLLILSLRLFLPLFLLFLFSGFALQKDPLYGFYYLGKSINALGGRRLDYPPARMWGGTTNVNGALWVRGYASFTSLPFPSLSLHHFSKITICYRNEYDSKVYEKYGGSSWSHVNNVADFKVSLSHSSPFPSPLPLPLLSLFF